MSFGSKNVAIDEEVRMSDIPKEVGRNLTAAEAAGRGGPPCTKPDTNSCSGGETKCVNGVQYECGKNGWSNTGKKC